MRLGLRPKLTEPTSLYFALHNASLGNGDGDVGGDGAGGSLGFGHGLLGSMQGNGSPTRSRGLPKGNAVPSGHVAASVLLRTAKTERKRLLRESLLLKVGSRRRLEKVQSVSQWGGHDADGGEFQISYVG